MDIIFRNNVGKFKFRIAGLILHKDQILLTRDNDGPYYYLPGGKLRLNETSIETIVREMQEEIQETVKVERLLWVVENFFQEQRNHAFYHEFSLYYLLSIPETSKILEKPVTTFYEANQVKIEMKWVPLNELKGLPVFPEFLKERVFSLPQTPEHIIVRS
jgi:ADP-ribose pyrophosphatase YjhB (NUDIX family)